VVGPITSSSLGCPTKSQEGCKSVTKHLHATRFYMD
jgi:hypothetical protein